MLANLIIFFIRLCVAIQRSSRDYVEADLEKPFAGIHGKELKHLLAFGEILGIQWCRVVLEDAEQRSVMVVFRLLNGLKVAIWAFPGSHFNEDWRDNRKCKMVGEPSLCNAFVHEGFNQRSDPRILNARKFLDLCGAHKVDHILFSGHSLGGATAVLLALKLVVAQQVRAPDVHVFRFGFPLVGDAKLRKLVKDLNIEKQVLTFVHKKDVVPRALQMSDVIDGVFVPPDLLSLALKGSPRSFWGADMAYLPIGRYLFMDDERDGSVFCDLVNDGPELVCRLRTIEADLDEVGGGKKVQIPSSPSTTTSLNLTRKLSTALWSSTSGRRHA